MLPRIPSPCGKIQLASVGILIFYYGQFVFPKVVLGEKAVVSKSKVGGKRAMRVYAL